MQGAQSRIADAFGVFDPNGDVAAPGTNVDALTPACRKLMDGIQDLLRYKEDAQKCEAELPKLIQMILCKYLSQSRYRTSGFL